MGLGKLTSEKMRSTCTTKKREQLVQIEWKWCDKVNRNNFKQKFYTTRNLWEDAPLPSLSYTLCLAMGTTFKCHFPLGPPSGSSKPANLYVAKFWTFIFLSNQVFFENARKISYNLKKHTPIRLHLVLSFNKFMVGNQILNLTPTPSFDHN